MNWPPQWSICERQGRPGLREVELKSTEDPKFDPIFLYAQRTEPRKNHVGIFLSLPSFFLPSFLPSFLLTTSLFHLSLACSICHEPHSLAPTPTPTPPLSLHGDGRPRDTLRGHITWLNLTKVKHRRGSPSEAGRGKTHFPAEYLKNIHSVHDAECYEDTYTPPRTYLYTYAETYVKHF